MQTKREGIGIVSWFIWALCWWPGIIYRKPYLIAKILCFVFYWFYGNAVDWIYISFMHPPADGAAMTAEYITKFKLAGEIPSLLMLPALYMSMALDAKRLRSFGGSALIAVVINGLAFAMVMPELASAGIVLPQRGPGAALPSLLYMGYVLCLLLVAPNIPEKPKINAWRVKSQAGALKSSGKKRKEKARQAEAQEKE